MSTNIRNFCIIAHIDHGKSTLADRFLELTGTVSKREMRDQLLDQMDIERERGITIKLAPVRMDYTLNAKPYTLNLIDTPGHVDFTYEVSRSLAAVEGAILLVDASQGVQAQTLGNLYLALEQNLTIIPVINKIDLPNAQVQEAKKELQSILGCSENEIILASGKTGQGVDEILRAVVERVPPPKGDPDRPLRALIFDSIYDEYRGVIAYVRVVDGSISKDDKIATLGTKGEGDVLEVGYFRPKLTVSETLQTGEIGYIVTGLKNISAVRVGDTITSYKLQVPHTGSRMAATTSYKLDALPGYKEVKPMVYAGLFPKNQTDFEDLREAIAKLKLNDAALQYEPERSAALGPGWRAGFLGLLHLEIVGERLRREHGLEIIVTVPSVAYKIYKTGGALTIIKSAAEFPNPSEILKIEEPYVKVDIVTPKDYVGALLSLGAAYHGIYKNTEFITEDRAVLHYEMPLGSILVDFYDKLKSFSSGYASLNYEFLDWRPADIVKLDILVAEEDKEELAKLVYSDEAYRIGRTTVRALREAIPRQQFEIKIQAALGGKVIAAERISALRKDVLAKLYGGDVTRKMKLLEKQKKGKKMLASGGHVDIPTEAYLKILKK